MNKLYIVKYKDEDSGNHDFVVVVAENYTDAVDEAIRRLMDTYGIKDGETLNCTGFKPCFYDVVGDYKIKLEGIK